jgi:hypothetical protein
MQLPACKEWINWVKVSMGHSGASTCTQQPLPSMRLLMGEPSLSDIALSISL